MHIFTQYENAGMLQAEGKRQAILTRAVGFWHFNITIAIFAILYGWIHPESKILR